MHVVGASSVLINGHIWESERDQDLCTPLALEIGKRTEIYLSLLQTNTGLIFQTGEQRVGNGSHNGGEGISVLEVALGELCYATLSPPFPEPLWVT
jgi:hypothetical protein